MFFQPIWLSHKQKASKVFVESNFIDFPGSAGPSRRRRMAACWRHHKEGNSSPRQRQRCSRPPVPRHLLQDLPAGFPFFDNLHNLDADFSVMMNIVL